MEAQIDGYCGTVQSRSALDAIDSNSTRLSTKTTTLSTPTSRTNNVRFLLVWEVYICGGHNTAGWLLPSAYNKKDPCLRCGLIAAPASVRTIASLFSTTMDIVDIMDSSPVSWKLLPSYVQYLAVPELFTSTVAMLEHRLSAKQTP
ncbi:hypothetical protein PENFLA_c001G07039 [Penicillium flavigenum]|uniref:Uncharacterized protein n=1 Tax=Penicillium flavigenum TaxID=254877 RepID=A0A1V6U498_9EURO|nr:hypothetical protein PENFLA_c001G07039 [Penicillium flavigenum]